MTTTQTDTHKQHPLRIGDEWVTTKSWTDVRSPWDQRLVGQVATGGPDLASHAVDCAERALQSPMPRHERAEILERMATLLEEQSEVFAHSISAEAGKPITLARGETERGAITLRSAATAARTLTGTTVPMDAHETGDGHIGWIARVPIGIVGAITPFNFPLNLVLHKVAAAIAAGCPVVLKPASQTPITALHLARITERAGLPPGWLNVVVGPAAEIAHVLTSDPRVRLITFTGSAAVGESLRTTTRYARLSLELGNMTPVIVDSTADLAAAASAIAVSACNYSGQTCVSTQRVFAHHSIIDDLRSLLVEQMSAIQSGDPQLDEVLNGPMINSAEHQRVLQWISDAEQAGARVLLGGTDAGNSVIAPTLVEAVPARSALGSHEVFGPVATLDAVPDLDAAFSRANATPYGLQASLFTGNISSMMRAADRLQFGSVLINESPSFRADHMPYGGTKSSGNTKEGPAYAIRDMTEERLIVLNHAPSLLT